jgi:PAS domain S-box-containing protein
MINQTELDWLGRAKEEVMGRSIFNLFTQDSIAMFRENFPAFKKRGSLRDLELEFVRKNGDIIPILVNATAVYDEQGNYTMSRSTVLDNTEHKAADEALRSANLELARAMRMKDEFLASMSHELRTPLNGILGLSEALQLDVYGPLNEKQKSTLVHVENSGHHLLELINDILDVSKIEAGKFELEMAPCSLGDICQSSIQLTKGIAGKKRQNVNFTMSPASITINADARRLKQVLVNLLSNAVKFTPENGSIGLEVTENESDNIVYMTVWDKGIGISPKDIKKLFQPFVQLDSSLSRQQTGTGLGLTLVQRLVEMHGGSIEIQSIPGQGSRFTVALPCLSADSATEIVENTFLSKFHYALIVEDEVMDAGHLARYCRALGVNPILHSTGKDTIERVKATRPNIIFLDIHLPDISGWDVLAQLKANPETQSIPVVITSVDDEKKKAFELNADGYLVKFFTISDLRTTLANLQNTQSTDETYSALSGEPIATVIIVDDNEINIETVVDYLGAKNFNVISARSGVDFLARVPQLHPDIVLMDIQMPEMDGLEAIRRLRAMQDQRLASVPVVALTALAMPGDRELCIEAGADEYVTKPFRLKEINELILQMLEDKKRTE